MKNLLTRILEWPTTLPSSISEQLTAQKKSPFSIETGPTGPTGPIDGKVVHEVVLRGQRMIWFIDQQGKHWRYFPHLERSFPIEVIHDSKKNKSSGRLE